MPFVNNCVTTNVVKFSLDLQHLVPLLLDPDLPPPRGQMVPPLTANRVLKLNYSLSTWPEVNVLVRALLRPRIFYFKLRVLLLKELIASCEFLINLASTVSSIFIEVTTCDNCAEFDYERGKKTSFRCIPRASSWYFNI